MKPWLKLFFSGWLMNSATRSLEQDAIGQRGYMRLIEDAWVSAWITVPLALLFVWVAWMLAQTAKKEIGE